MRIKQERWLETGCGDPQGHKEWIQNKNGIRVSKTNLPKRWGCNEGLQVRRTNWAAGKKAQTYIQTFNELLLPIRTLFSAVSVWSSVLLVQLWALGKGLCLSHSRDHLHLWQNIEQVPAHELSVWLHEKRVRVTLVWGNHVHSDDILADMTWLGVEAGFVFLSVFVHLFLNKWSPAMLGGSALVPDLGSSMLSSRFIFLGDGRWMWDFRARQAGPVIKVSCIWMPSWWTGFSFLSYPNQPLSGWLLLWFGQGLGFLADVSYSQLK